MKNSLFQGSLILMCAGFLGKLLGAFYRIPLSNILGPEGIGIYQMVFSVFSLALIISSGGVTATVAHKVAKIRAGAEGSEKEIFLKGLLYSCIVSFLFAILFVVLGGKLSLLQGALGGRGAYIVAGVALIFSSVLASFRGLYQGHQNMLPTAVSQMLEQVFKLVFGLVFSFLFVKQSLALGVMGAFLGITLAEIISFVYLVIKTRKFRFSGAPKQKKEFVKTNLVITSTALVIPLVIVFDSFVVVNLLSGFLPAPEATALFGLQSGLVSSIINFPVVASVAASLALLPMLSFHLQSDDKLSARQAIEKMCLVCFAILIPCTLILVFFAKDILLFLYPSLSADYLNISSILMQISAPQILFIAVTQIMTSVLQSLNKPHFATFTLLFAGFVKAVLVFILVANPNIGIVGMAISTLVFYGISSGVLVLCVQKYLPFCLEKKVLFLGGVMCLMLATSFFAVNFLFEGLLTKIIFAGLGFLMLYVLPLYFANFFGIRNFLVAKLKARGTK